MSHNLLTTITLGILASNALFTFIQFLISRHDQKKDNAVKRALKNILARDLLIDMREWLHADDRTAEDWEMIDNEYHSYKELGGNGKIRKLYEECNELHITE